MFSFFRTFLCLLHIFIFTFCAAHSVRAKPAESVALLQGLDKITARVTTIKVPVGVAVRFGTLAITVKRCHKRPPEETPETTAYLEIRESRTGERPRNLFSGWMFGSSPAVSLMEHPVYDVWVIDCKKASSSR
jgi:hypothetical protein